MTPILKRISLIFGIGLLVLSIYWSQDGFNFSVAGDAGNSNGAAAVGYFVAAGATLLQFVFSTNLKGLNLTLVVFGLVAYLYSIYTNYLGITHMQGSQANHVAGWILAIAIDGVPEPLIAWSLGEALTGDFLGNALGAFGSFMTGKPLGAGQQNHQPQQNNKPKDGNNGHHGQQQGKGDKQKGFQRREELSKMYHGGERRQGGQGKEPPKVPMLRNLSEDEFE